jgi:Fur family transcriptional regulator, zinc uptake regulator
MADAAVIDGRPPFEIYLEEGARRGIQWTPNRRMVLHLVWSAPEPIGAYEAAARLRRTQGKIHPTSIYRSLYCLQQVGLIIPVATWKRYLLSPDPAVPLWGLLLCKGCGDCTPFALSAEFDALARKVRLERFRPSDYRIECEGVCSACSLQGRPS